MKNKSLIKRLPDIFTASYIPFFAYVLFFSAVILIMMCMIKVETYTVSKCTIVTAKGYDIMLEGKAPKETSYLFLYAKKNSEILKFHIVVQETVGGQTFYRLEEKKKLEEFVNKNGSKEYFVEIPDKSISILSSILKH